MKIIIHVGLHKTGTTFFQNQIFNNVPNAKLIRGPNFTTQLQKNKMNIISSEALSGAPYVRSDAKIRFTIADRIKSCFPDARIIIGIREEKSWLKSLYSQFIRNGGFYDFDSWLEKVVDKDYFDQESYIKYLKSLFSNVYVFSFEDFCKNKKEVVTEMCKFMEVNYIDYQDIKYNTKLSKNRLNIIKYLNRIWISNWNPNGVLPKKRFFNPEFFGELFDLNRILYEGKDISNKENK
jgi:hypothetical protein